MNFVGNAQWAFRGRALRAPTGWVLLKLFNYNAGRGESEQNENEKF